MYVLISLLIHRYSYGLSLMLFILTIFQLYFRIHLISHYFSIFIHLLIFIYYLILFDFLLYHTLKHYSLLLVFILRWITLYTVILNIYFHSISVLYHLYMIHKYMVVFILFSLLISYSSHYINSISSHSNKIILFISTSSKILFSTINSYVITYFIPFYLITYCVYLCIII